MKNRHIAVFLLILLISSLAAVPILPVGVEAEEPEQVVYRGDNYVDTNLGDGRHSWESAHQWVYNGSHYVPFIFSETANYYQVQSGLIGARIFKAGYAEFWDPNMTEVRLYEETWEVGYYDKGRWKVCDTYSPEHTVSMDESTVNITASFVTDWPNSGERSFTVKYIFRAGKPLKHEIDFTSYATEQYEFNVTQKWAGIVAEKVQHDEGEDNITSATIVNSSKFRFIMEDGSLSIFENQYQAIEYLEPVIIDTHAQGLKCDFIFSNFTLAQGEALEIDPATATLSNPWCDGEAVSHETPGIYSYYDNQNSLEVGDIGSGDWINWEFRSHSIWTIDSIPDNANVFLMKFKYNIVYFGDVYRIRIYQLLESGQDWYGYSDSAKYSDMGDGHHYVSIHATGTGQNLEIELGDVAEADLEAALSGELSLWGIGLTDYDNDYANAIEFGAEELPGVPPPTLYVEYSRAPTITSVTNTDMDDTDNWYSMKKYYSSVVIVNDVDGAIDIDKIYLQGKNGAAVLWEVRATDLTGAGSWIIQSGSDIIDIDAGSCTYEEDGNVGTATFKIRTEWDHGNLADLELAVYVEDSFGLSAGWTVKRTNYFDTINRLVTESFAASDGRINRGTSETFSGNVRYSTTTSDNTASSSYPPDAQFTAIRIHDSGHAVKGSDTTIVNGAFSLNFNIPDAVQNNDYHVYLDLVADYSDADAPDGDIVSVVGDQMEIVSVSFNDSRVNLNAPAEVRYQLRYDYDDVVFNSSKGSVTGFTWDATNSWWDKDITGSSSPESVNYDENDIEFTDSIYDLTTIENDAGSNIIYDRWKLLSFWTSNDNPKTGQTVYLYATAELEYDGHAPEGEDILVIEGEEFTWDWENERFYAEVNKSTAGAITYDTLTSIEEYSYNITLGTMNGLSVTVTWGDYEYHFYGLYNENGSFVEAINMSAHMPTDTEIFEVDGYQYKAFAEEPQMFSWSLSGGGSRFIYKFQDIETIYLFQPDQTYSVYSFTIRDYTGQVGKAETYLESLRIVNGTERMIERQVIWDTANAVPLTLVQSQIYALQVRFEDNSTYRFGYFIPGAEATPTLSIYDIAFSDQAHMPTEHILVEAQRPADTHIRVNYKDELDDTEEVFVEVCLLNETQVWNDTGAGDILQFNWYGADNETDYMVNVEMTHDFYGELTYTCWLAGAQAAFEDPFDLTLFGDWPIKGAFAVFLIIGTACLFSRGSAVIGMGATVLVAAALAGIGWIAINYTVLAICFALVVMWGLGGAK